MFTKIVYRILVGAVAVGLASVAYANPTETLQTKYYDINGNSAIGLRREMNAKGVTEDGGDTYDAYTKYYIKWNYKYFKQSSLCRLNPISVTTDTTITLPRWRNKNAANLKLQRQWENYFSALKQHDAHSHLAV